MKKLILFFVVVCLLSCNEISKKCDEYYNNYIDLSFESKNDEALSAINKAIECNEKSEEYRFEKVKHLISMSNLLEAKKSLSALGKINNSFVTELPLKAILELRSGDKLKGDKELREVFKNLSKIKYDKDNFNKFFYKLLTQIYVEGKQSTIRVINNQDIYNSLNEKEVIVNLENMINSEMDSLDILYKTFQIIY